MKDITKLFPDYAAGLYKMYTNEELLSAKVDGKLVAVPNLSPKAEFNYAIIREDLRKKYHIPEIKNYSDYDFFLKTIKEKESTVFPLYFDHDGINMFANKNSYAVLDQGLGLLYKWDDPSMKIIPFERAPEFGEFIGMISGWYKNGYYSLDNGNSFSGSESDRQQFAMETMFSRKTASFIGNAGTADIMNDLKKTRPNTANCEFKSYLLCPAGNVQRKNPIDSCIVFSNKSKNVERALMFMNWVQQSQENYDLFMYGIKGEHYVIDKPEGPKGIYTDRSQYYLGWPGHQAFENLRLNRFIGSSSYYSDEEKDAYDNALLNGTKNAPHIGFYPDYSNLGTDISVRISSLEQLIAGMFSNEKMDVETKKMLDDSTDKINKTIQQQLDQWKENK